MKPDPIARELAWLDDIFIRTDKSLFHNAEERAIQDELSKRWKSENRLDLLNGLAARSGEKAVMSVIDGIISSDCRASWKKTGEESGNSLTTFISLLWEPLTGAGFEYTMERKGNKTQFQVTKCPLVGVAKELGAEKWLYHLACLTDEPSVTGFNPDIAFDRTQTLMEGHPVCNHCYTVKRLD
jgi:predicted ArsR family transcriptional regulator